MDGLWVVWLVCGPFRILQLTKILVVKCHVKRLQNKNTNITLTFGGFSLNNKTFRKKKKQNKHLYLLCQFLFTQQIFFQGFSHLQVE